MQELGNRLWEQSRVFTAEEQMEKRTLAALFFGILGWGVGLFVFTQKLQAQPVR